MARYTKKQAAEKLGVSPSTIDRRISDGTLRTEREQHGRTHRIWVLLEDDEVDEVVEEAIDGVDGMTDASPDKSAASGESMELAVLRERCARLEELAEYRGELLVESEKRTQMLIAELASAQRTSEALARALPPAPLEPPEPPPFMEKRRLGLLGWLRLR